MLLYRHPTHNSIPLLVQDIVVIRPKPGKLKGRENGPDSKKFSHSIAKHISSPRPGHPGRLPGMLQFEKVFARICLEHLRHIFADEQTFEDPIFEGLEIWRRRLNWRRGSRNLPRNIAYRPT